MNDQINNTSGGPLISAFRVYFDTDSDSVEKFIANPPYPWKTHGHNRCKIALRNAGCFSETLAVFVWAESLGAFNSKTELETDLLRALNDAKIGYSVIEDVSRIKSERERLDKIGCGLKKLATPESIL